MTTISTSQGTSFNPSAASERIETTQTNLHSPAIAGLSLRGNSASRQEAQPEAEQGSDCPKEDASQTDSGYVSQLSSLENPEELSISGSSLGNQTRLWPSFRRNKIRLKSYNIPIPKLTQDRFNDLREQYADEIKKLMRGVPGCRSILMTLKVLGASESEAEPWVFIQCDKIIAKKVRNFFKQPSLLEDFQPPNPGLYSPYFKIYVCELAPTLLTKGKSSQFSRENEEIDCYVDINAPYDVTLCGAVVKAVIDGQDRFATIGGLIEVGLFPRRIFAMTAGHFLLPSSDTKEASVGEESDSVISEEFSEVDADSISGDDCYELDLDALPMNERAYQLRAHDITSEIKMAPETWMTLGSVCKTSEDLPLSDWALIEIKNPSLHLPNSNPNLGVDDSLSSFEVDEALENLEVTLFTSQSGFTRGRLSSSTHSLLVASGISMSTTYEVQLDENIHLQKGDSGSWVFDSCSCVVYGHIVATDIFGTVYIVPLENSLNEMKWHLEEDTIQLYKPQSTSFLPASKFPPAPYLSEGSTISSIVSSTKSWISTPVADSTISSAGSSKIKSPTSSSFSGPYMRRSDYDRRYMSTQPTPSMAEVQNHGVARFDEDEPRASYSTSVGQRRERMRREGARRYGGW